jgi:hypothetical protein
LLFWFCEGLACVSGKTKCAKCGRANSFFCAVGCFNFFLYRLVFRQIGLLVCVELQRSRLPIYGRLKGLVKMSKCDCFVVTLMVAVSFNRLAYNVFGLGEGGDFHHKC